MSDAENHETLSVTRDAGVTTILLDRPESRNAVSRRMRDELRGALEGLASDDQTRVLIIAGRGHSFCSGTDLAEPDPPRADRLLLDDYLPIIQSITTMDKQVISAVSGAAAGVGMSLALACDLTIMADDAYFWAPFTRIGLVPDGGLTWLLTQQLGYRGAFAVAIEAERIPARRALELALAHKLVPTAELHTRADEWARELAAGSQLAQAHTKRITRLATHATFEDVFSAEAHAQAECENSEFYINARNAFLNK